MSDAEREMRHPGKPDPEPGKVAPPGYVRGVDGKWYPRERAKVHWSRKDGSRGRVMTSSDRVDIAARLRSEGKSLRAIAAELHVSPEQVRRDLSRIPKLLRDTYVSPTDSAEGDTCARITGRDGKSYPATRKPAT